jgi:formylmethanofuran:tetrahydromethanopterin formyltransferase
MTKSHNVTFAAVAAMAVLLSSALLVSSLASPAEAKIECKNPADKTPTGQQGKDRCRGQALDNENPSGHEPGGWNK